MGGFAAEFRGFWAGRGCSAAIQRTADMDSRSGRKKFLKIYKKGVENPKIGVWEGSRDSLYRRCSATFGPGS